MKVPGFSNLLFAVCALLGALVADASAAPIIPGYPDDLRYAFDSREVSLLPRYCIHAKLFRNAVPGGNNQAEIDRWYGVMGPTFEAIHHYCWALMETNRALLLAKDKQTKAYYLKAAIDDIDYVLRYAPRDFVLMPEILTKKGENLVKLGRGVEGTTELERAIEIKPDYWPPYAELSDYYQNTGNVAKAREMLEKGLSFAPDAKALTRRLAELDRAKEKKKSSQREASGG